jgi:hypothetical protein
VKLLLKIVLFFVFINNLSFAYETKGQLINLDENKTLIEGELINAKLKIWPLQSAIPSEIKKTLEGTDFLGLFHITNVKKVEFSENNNEMLDIDLSLVVIKKFEKQPFYIWSYKALNIPIEVVDLRTVLNPNKSKGILVEKTDYTYISDSNIKYYIIAILVVILCVILNMFFRHRARVKIEKRKIEEKHKKWNEVFSNAETRKDYEYVYHNREKWLELLPVKSPPISIFFEILNEHQYKKEWDIDNEVEVRHCFDEIRNVFVKKA